jgi:hypothetical protein
MKKLVLILSFLAFVIGSPQFCKAQISIPEGLKPGVNRSSVRALIGLPVQMRGDMWKYKDFVVIFESNAVKCIVRSDCFGKWSDCRSFEMRSPECIIDSKTK